MAPSLGKVLLVVGPLLAACGPLGGPRTDSQTNWVQACTDAADCGRLDCVCGVCTQACASDDECGSLRGASCALATEVGVIARCGGQAPPAAGLCLARCEPEACAEGQACVAGICGPTLEPTERVVVDLSVRHQALLGFGATVAYNEAEILGHARRDALFAAMFAELGLDVLRLRNRFGHVGDDQLDTAGALVEAAATGLGRPPALLLSSWSPPAALKANGTLECRGDFSTCTLARTETGGFDYAGFAEYWRAALAAYAAVGVVPDAIGLQNNPDFIPSATTPGEGCRFLPVEGTTTAMVDGAVVTLEYPGLAEAQAAVVEALAELDAPPPILAPETASAAMVAEFLAPLDLGPVGTITHHLYGMDAAAIDVRTLSALGELARSLERPLLQTEMMADGYSTALLVHHTLVTAGAGGYLQAVLAGPVGSPGTLITLELTDFALADPYHALRHYAHATDPDWIRVDAVADSAAVLVSAWLSPGEEALTVVLVNADATPREVALELGDFAGASAMVSRTVFFGLERSAELGELGPAGAVSLPGNAIVTVALRR